MYMIKWGVVKMATGQNGDKSKRRQVKMATGQNGDKSKRRQTKMATGPK